VREVAFVACSVARWPGRGPGGRSLEGGACGPAERQRRYRERRAAGVPVQPPARPPRPKDQAPPGGPRPWPSSGPLQGPNTRPGATSSPSPLADSRTAELLDGVLPRSPWPCWLGRA